MKKRMTKIISIAHQKGGVGKSVVACMLATELQKRRYDVVLIDSDKQGSLLTKRASQLQSLQSQGEETATLPLVEIVAANELQDISKVIKTKNGLVDYFIIDTPGVINDEVKQILKNSDIILIPVTNGDSDWDALQTVIPVINSVRGQGTQVIAMYNKVSPTTRWKEFMAAMPEYFNFNDIILPSMKTSIHGKYQPLQLGNRDEYQTIDTILALTDRKTSNRKAKTEAAYAVSAIIELL